MTNRSKLALGALGAAALVALVVVAARGARSAPPGPSRSGLTTTLVVEPFRALDPAPTNWTPATFAESLTARLATMPGLVVRVAGAASPRPDYTLRGDVTARDGRLVIATRLFEPDERTPLWSATFWRSDSPNPSLASDLAADVAEALYGHLARRAVSAGEERP